MEQYKLIVRDLNTSISEGQKNGSIIRTKVFLKKEILDKYIKRLHPEHRNWKTEVITEPVQLKCICCNKELEILYEEETWMYDTSKPDNGLGTGMIGDGMCSVDEAGYGSTHDTSFFLLSICDTCIDEKLGTGQLIYLGDAFL